MIEFVPPTDEEKRPFREAIERHKAECNARGLPVDEARALAELKAMLEVEE
jgi:hypothetical protein